MDRLEDVAVASFHRRRFTGEVDRHLDGDLLLEVHGVEVDVDRAQATRVGLDLANEDLCRPLTVDLEVDQVGPPRLDENLLELEPVEHQRGRLGVVAIDHGGQLSLAVKAPGSLAEEFAGGGVQLHV